MHADCQAATPATDHAALMSLQTVYDDYSNARNKVALKDSSYEEVATAKARMNIVSGFLKALEMEEAADMYRTEMDKGSYNDTNKPLLAPTIRAALDAYDYVEMVKEHFPDLVMQCYILDCKPALGFYKTDRGPKCKPCEVGVRYSDQTDDGECLKNLDECGPGEKLVVSTSAAADSACVRCESGTFNAHTDGSTTCEPYSVTSCPAGKQLDTDDKDKDAECTACDTGRFQSVNGAGAHHQCATYSDLTCALGQEEQDGAADKDVACVTCPAGKSTYVTGEMCRLSKAPITCAAGHQNDAMSHCVACPSGTFKSIHGSGKCTARLSSCPVVLGQYVARTGGRMATETQLVVGSTTSNSYCLNRYVNSYACTWRGSCSNAWSHWQFGPWTGGNAAGIPRAPPPPPSCFPASGTVQTPDGQVRMDELQVGDAVLDSDGAFSPVYMFAHKDRKADSPYVELRTATNHTIQMSSTHYIEADGVMMNAGDVRPSMTVTAGGEQSAVTSTKMITATGLYNPLTLSGTIVVNGVAASAHSEWFLDGLVPTSWLPIVYQVHHLASPINFLSSNLRSTSDPSDSSDRRPKSWWSAGRSCTCSRDLLDEPRMVRWPA